MSNYLASYISNGTDRASIMNALKTSEDGTTITLYSTDNEEFASSVVLSKESNTVATAVEEPVHGSYNIAVMTDSTTQASDCTSIIQDQINICAENGGGCVILGRGKYLVSGLTLKSKVHLVGSGVGNTILERIPNKAISYNTVDTYYNGSPFILVPVTASGCSISDMTLYGSATLANTAERPLQLSGVTTYSDTNIINGIQIPTAPFVAVDGGGNNITGYESEYTNTSNEYLTSYKSLILSNLSIIGFSGSGIVISANNTDIQVSNVRALFNRCAGFIIAGEHCELSNIVSNGNGDCGIIDSGTYNQFSNITVDFNGKYNHSGSYGYKCEASKSSISNLTCRANWCTGFYLNGNYNSISNIMADANGGRSSLDSDGGNANPKDVPQVKLSGNGNTIKGIITNYIATSTISVASRGLETDNALINSNLNFIIESSAGENKPYVYPVVSVDNSVYNDYENYNSNLVTIQLIS